MVSSFPARGGPPRAPTEKDVLEVLLQPQLPTAWWLPTGAPQEAGGHTVLGTPQARQARPECWAAEQSARRLRRRVVLGLSHCLPGVRNVLFPGPLALSPPLMLTWVFLTVCRSSSTLAGLVSPSLSPGEAHVSISFVIKTKHQAVPRSPACLSADRSALRLWPCLPRGLCALWVPGGLTRVRVPHTQPFPLEARFCARPASTSCSDA